MAAVEITKESVPVSAAGYNLTDSADFATLVAGSGNGVKFTYEEGVAVLLKNDTGGAATFTFTPQISSGYTAYGVTASNPTLAVANGKTYLVHLNSIFRASDGFVTIECSVAGKVLVLEP